MTCKLVLFCITTSSFCGGISFPTNVIILDSSYRLPTTTLGGQGPVLNGGVSRKDEVGTSRRDFKRRLLFIVVNFQGFRRTASSMEWG
jgi:hypothetical protein